MCECVYYQRLMNIDEHLISRCLVELAADKPMDGRRRRRRSLEGRGRGQGPLKRRGGVIDGFRYSFVFLFLHRRPR